MKRIIYILAIAAITSISFSSCQRKAITQAEIDEFSRQVNEQLAALDNNDDSTTSITIDSTGTDSIVKVNTPNNDKKAEITIIQQSNDGEDIGVTIVIFTAITMPFACIVLIVFFIIRGITIGRRDHNKLIEKAIESNYPLPDNFFNAPKRTKSRLQSGLVWLAWGLGIISIFLIISDDTVYAIGLIPLFVGVAKLITYFVEDRKKEDNQ